MNHRVAIKLCRGGIVLLLAACCIGAEPVSSRDQALALQRAQYDADSTKTILELQPLRVEARVAIKGPHDEAGVATLTNLNPNINSWHLLSLTWAGTAAPANYHLESPRHEALHLVPGDPLAIRIAGEHGSPCTVWVSGTMSALDQASRSGLPYSPLCEGALYLRNPVTGHHTSLEQVTDFLRDHVWGAETLITITKRELYRDAFLEKGGTRAAADIARAPASPFAPLAASVAQEDTERGIVPQHLGLTLATSAPLVYPGQWYPVQDVNGISVSVIAPENVERSIRYGHEADVNPLDAIESSALVYLVAFDLRFFDLHFVLGTDHPRLDWSERPPPSSKDPRLPGPDGVASATPLVTNGMVSPADANHTIATFTGGFKRSHGAFHVGALAQRNHGSHYGFLQEGVIFSKLEPGLATVLVTDAGAVDVKTWNPSDDAQLPHIRYARQNGVPLIEYDPAHGRGVPGALVNLWGPGNWSGSANEDLRTLRAGLCLQESAVRRFIIYGYFSAATPSAMARVFQAYHCHYAMHLDMNALEHTYLALYARHDHQRLVEHLIQGMQVLDRTAGNEVAPRFLAFPDNRDFFYLTQRRASP